MRLSDLACSRFSYSKGSRGSGRHAHDGRRKSRPRADDKGRTLGEHASPIHHEPPEEEMYAAKIRAHLDTLHLERLAAEAAGLTECAAYMADLEDEISEYRAAYVGAAVTEIAVARRELSGRLVG
jgi:hypothetical protein